MTDFEKLVIGGIISALVAWPVSLLSRRNAVTQEQLKSDLIHEQERTKGTTGFFDHDGRVGVRRRAGD